MVRWSGVIPSHHNLRSVPVFNPFLAPSCEERVEKPDDQQRDVILRSRAPTENVLTVAHKSSESRTREPTPPNSEDGNCPCREHSQMIHFSVLSYFSVEGMRVWWSVQVS